MRNGTLRRLWRLTLEREVGAWGGVGAAVRRQGIKKGIVELADMVVVTKADGDLLPAARRAKLEYLSALKFVQPKHAFWQTQVCLSVCMWLGGCEWAYEAQAL
jgi:LAO/AO transport system kinase